jgi:hypothetical protein
MEKLNTSVMTNHELKWALEEEIKALRAVINTAPRNAYGSLEPGFFTPEYAQRINSLVENGKAVFGDVNMFFKFIEDVPREP